VLRELWLWREAEATAANRPPYFVLAHETVLKLAVAAAEQDACEKLFPRGLSQRRRQGALDAIHRGAQLEKSALPQPFKHKFHRPTEAERKRFLELSRRRDKQAHQLELDPTLIASRADLARLSQDWDQYAPELMRWQHELLK
jgi:ribonuclease D